MRRIVSPYFHLQRSPNSGPYVRDHVQMHHGMTLNRSTLGQALRDDNFRWLCSSLVGANGCSPEKGPGWNLCLLREKRDRP